MIEDKKVDKSFGSRSSPNKSIRKPEVSDPSISTGATGDNIYNNIYYIEGRVIQRNTYYTHSFNNYLKYRLRKRKSYIINFRVSEEELGILEELMEKRNTENLSQVIREAIRVYHGLLCNTGSTGVSGGVVIQNPIINIVEAKSESKTEINIDLSEIAKLVTRLYQLRDPLPPLQRKLVEKIYSKLSKQVITN